MSMPYWRGIDTNVDGRNNVHITNPQSDALEIIHDAASIGGVSENSSNSSSSRMYTNYIRTLFFDADAPIPVISGASYMLLKLMATSADFISVRAVAVAHFLRAIVSIVIFPLIAYVQYSLVVERLPSVASGGGGGAHTTTTNTEQLIAAVAFDFKIGCALTIVSGFLTLYLARLLWTAKNGQRHIDKRDTFHSCMTIAAATLDVTGVFMMRRKFVSDHVEEQ